MSSNVERHIVFDVSSSNGGEGFSVDLYEDRATVSIPSDIIAVFERKELLCALEKLCDELRKLDTWISKGVGWYTFGDGNGKKLP